MGYEDYFTQSYNMGRWDECSVIEDKLTGIFHLTTIDKQYFHELRGATKIHVTRENSIVRIQVI